MALVYYLRKNFRKQENEESEINSGKGMNSSSRKRDTKNKDNQQGRKKEERKDDKIKEKTVAVNSEIKKGN